jgi:hypothetical protein
MSSPALPPEQNAEPEIKRIFLTVEIDVRDPKMAETAAEMIRMELKTAIMFINAIQANRKGAPSIVVHEISVER